MIRAEHPLASIRGATNAIYIQGPSVGELLFAGPGAGGEPTATAMLGDIVDAARELLSGSVVASPMRFAPGDVLDFGQVATKWYLRLEVVDQPGVLAQIAGAFGEAGVSIKSVWQEGRGDRAMVLLVTHEAVEEAQRRATEGLRALDVVAEIPSIIRVESDEP
jgi:homoserine dehydrogenase